MYYTEKNAPYLINAIIYDNEFYKTPKHLMNQEV